MNQFALAVLIFGLCASVKALPAVSTKNGARKTTATVLNATQAEFPYQVSLRRDGSHACGASLAVIKGQQVILTAAHCVEIGSAQDYTVVAGGIDILKTSGFQQTRQVSSIIKHEKYDFIKRANDIAILNIKSPFDLNRNIAPIALPKQGQDTTGDVLISSWGGKLFEGYTSGILQKTKIPIVKNDVCKKDYAGIFVPITPSVLCSGIRGASETCRIETGGPVRAANGGYLAGIVSWREGCAHHEYAGINTRVSHYIDWMNSRVNANDEWQHSFTFANLFTLLFRPK